MNGDKISLGRRLPNTELYCLTAREYSNGKSNVEIVKELIDAGIKIIQYREKDNPVKKMSMREKYSECLKIRYLTNDAGVTFIVNDHIELAISVGADGIHIGQDDLPAEEVRRLVGNDMIVGLSTHSPEQAEKAIVSDVDYIGVGPIFKTFTKKDVCDPVGFNYLDYVVANIDIPFVAIGGIKESNVTDVVEHGAKCIAMVTEIVGANNIGLKINSVINKIMTAKG